MQLTGLEPARGVPTEPKSVASANSAIAACDIIKDITKESFRNNPHRGICRMYVKPQSDYVQARISYNPETTQFAMPTGSRTHSKNRCAYRSLSRHSPYASNPKAFRLRASSQRQSSVLDAHGSLLHAKCDDAKNCAAAEKRKKKIRKK